MDPTSARAPARRTAVSQVSAFGVLVDHGARLGRIDVHGCGCGMRDSLTNPAIRRSLSQKIRQKNTLKWPAACCHGLGRSFCTAGIGRRADFAIELSCSVRPPTSVPAAAPPPPRAECEKVQYLYDYLQLEISSPFALFRGLSSRLLPLLASQCRRLALRRPRAPSWIAGACAGRSAAHRSLDESESRIVLALLQSRAARRRRVDPGAMNAGWGVELCKEAPGRAARPLRA